MIKRFYCNKPFRSKDYTKYWNLEKEKCREGAIYYSKENMYFILLEIIICG